MKRKLKNPNSGTEASTPLSPPLEKGGEEKLCPLCGKRFSEEGMKCSGCLLSKNCNLLCCPHCGYTYKEQSAIVDFLKSLWRRKTKP